MTKLTHKAALLIILSVTLVGCADISLTAPVGNDTASKAVTSSTPKPVVSPMPKQSTTTSTPSPTVTPSATPHATSTPSPTPSPTVAPTATPKAAVTETKAKP